MGNNVLGTAQIEDEVNDDDKDEEEKELEVMIDTRRLMNVVTVSSGTLDMSSVCLLSSVVRLARPPSLIVVKG